MIELQDFQYDLDCRTNEVVWSRDLRKRFVGERFIVGVSDVNLKLMKSKAGHKYEIWETYFCLAGGWNTLTFPTEEAARVKFNNLKRLLQR